MRRSAPALPLAAALLLLAASGADASGTTIADRSVRASVEVVTADGGTYAVVMLESRLRLRLVGSLDLYVDGNQVKLGTVETSDLLLLSERLGDAGADPSVCLRFEGRLESSDDSYRRIELSPCAGELSRPAPQLGAGPFVERSPLRQRPLGQ